MCLCVAVTARRDPFVTTSSVAQRCGLTLGLPLWFTPRMCNLAPRLRKLASSPRPTILSQRIVCLKTAMTCTSLSCSL
jgi:hypothetical protein